MPPFQLNAPTVDPKTGPRKRLNLATFLDKSDRPTEPGIMTLPEGSKPISYQFLALSFPG
jgi:hypothetical protein